MAGEGYTVPTLTQLDDAKANEASALIKAEFLRKLSNGEWSLVMDKDEVTVHKLDRKTAGTKVNCYKLTTTVQASQRACLMSVTDYTERLKWDPSIAPGSESQIGSITIGKEVRELNRTITSSAAGGAISSREFIDLAVTETLDDGVSILHYAGTIESPDYPKIKGTVRGVNFPCGMKFVTNADGTTTYEYVVHSDIKGWVPTSLVNSTVTSVLHGAVVKMRGYAVKSDL